MRHNVNTSANSPNSSKASANKGNLTQQFSKTLLVTALRYVINGIEMRAIVNGALKWVNGDRVDSLTVLFGICVLSIIVLKLDFT